MHYIFSFLFQFQIIISLKFNEYNFNKQHQQIKKEIRETSSFKLEKFSVAIAQVVVRVASAVVLRQYQVLWQESAVIWDRWEGSESNQFYLKT